MIPFARFVPVFLLLVPTLLLSSVQAAVGCVDYFRVEPGIFDVCKEAECIVFRTEEPFITLDPRMNSSTHEKPFLRDERLTKWNNLEGPFFEIIEQIQSLSTAYYVWGGPTCKFDDMITFVQNTSQITETDGSNSGYKFIAGGVLFMLKYRMSIYSIPSAPLLEDQLVIVGPRVDDNATWSNAWAAMWRPFTTKAWLMLIMTILFVLFLRVWVSYFFTDKAPKFKWSQFRDNFIGDYDDLKGARNRQIRAPKHHNRMEAKRLNTYLSNGLGIFFVITILYYEIAVVDFIFEERMDSLGNLDPSKFAITSNSTMDRVFQQKYEDDVKCAAPCWKRVKNISAVYSTITQKGSKHTFTAVYETFNRHSFRKDTDLCKTLQLLEYPTINRRFAGVMFYSSNIPVKRRIEIDQNIVLLREQGKLREIIHKKTGESLPAKCETTGSISVLLLSLPLFLFPGPIFAVVFFYMAMYTLKRRNERLDIEEDDNDGVPDDSTDNCSGDTTTFNTSSMLSNSANCDCFLSQSSDPKVQERERQLRLYTMRR